MASARALSWRAIPVWASLSEEVAGECDPNIAPKFPVDAEINAKLALWAGDIRTLQIDAIVNPTNENMSDMSGLSGAILEAAGPEIRAEIYKTDPCRTGEARLNQGYRLPARHVVHTVSPRFNEKYRTAAENALHNCYRSSLALIKENELRTIAFPVVHSTKKGYPLEAGAHIALRTIRRFLEHWGSALDMVVLVFSSTGDLKLYQKLTSLYFPRNRQRGQKPFKKKPTAQRINRPIALLGRAELKMSREFLPRDVGNEYGETVVEERKIRIAAHPGTNGNHNNSHAPVHVDSGFVSMKGDVDATRMKAMTEKDLQRMRQAQIYGNYLRIAMKEDLSEVSKLECILEGKDARGRPVVLVLGKRLPSENARLLDRTFLYLIRLMDSVAERDYSVIYVHSDMDGKTTPDAAWLKKVYNILDYKYGEHLVSFFVLHPTFWLKVAETVVSAFMSDSKRVFEKVKYMASLKALFDVLDRSLIPLPEYVFQFDIKEFGALSIAKSTTKTSAESVVNDL